MRHTTFEEDEIGKALLETMASITLYPLVELASKLDEPLAEITFLVIGVVVTFMCQRLRAIYVSGRRYRSVPLDGKVYIVTGSNTGIGYETALALVRMGGTVVLACRSPDKAAQARDHIIELTNCSATRVIVIKLDLCGFDSVRKFVKEFRALGLPLHGLINNAGLMLEERCLTQDGFEMVFTANHLSHFLLTNLLLPDLEKTSGRVVVVSSCTHKGLRSFNIDDVMSEKSYSLLVTYAQSKLANHLFAFELQRRLTTKNSTVTCNVVHPGIVNTEVTRHMNGLVQIGIRLAAPLLSKLRKTPEEGCYTSVFAAVDPSLKDKGGLYLLHCRPTRAGTAALDVEMAGKLWALSEKLTGLAH